MFSGWNKCVCSFPGKVWGAGEDGCFSLPCPRLFIISTPGKVIIGVIHFLTGLIAANLGIENSLLLLFWPGSSLAQFLAQFFVLFFLCSRRTIDFGGNQV